MTRINLVPPSELHTKHLVAEYRELPRIFGLVRKAISRGENFDDKRNPTEYVLGSGHVRFFYNKLMFLYIRQLEIVQEMQVRGITVSYHPSPVLFDGIPQKWLGHYIPTDEALALNRQRILDRYPVK